MQTKLSRSCDAIIEAGWLAALVLAPLFFNTYSSRVFEPDKIHLVRSIALLVGVAWLVQLIDGVGRREPGGPSLWDHLRRTPLVAPALILLLTYLISTALSVVPRISLLGSYVRLQGAWTFLSYIVLFGAVLTHLRSQGQVRRLVHTITITSLPIAIYGIIQNAGLDPLPWGGDVVERVAANMGNAIFVAAYLIMAVFLTLERLFRSFARLIRSEQGSSVTGVLSAGAYLFVLGVQITAIVFTQSRGPQLGLAAGLYVFLMLGLLLLARPGGDAGRGPAILRALRARVHAAWLTLVGLSIAGIALLVVLNVPNGPLGGLCNVRYVGRTCTLFSLSEGTNAVRVLIWEGVLDMMSSTEPLRSPDGRSDPFTVIRPLVGYGPESLWVAFNRFYPPELGRLESRNASPDRSHNETFDTLARGGLLQFAAQIFLFASIFYHALRWLGLIRSRRARNTFIIALAAGGLAGILLPLTFDGSLRLAGIGLPAGLIVGLIVYVTIDLLSVHPERDDPAPAAVHGRGNQLLILAILSALVAHFVEVHFGIAIVATLTHFWVLAGALVAVGLGWVREDAEPAPVAAAAAPAVAAAVAPARRGAKGGSQKGKGKEAARRSAPAPARQAAPGRPRGLTALLPYAFVMATISAVLAWNFVVNQFGATGAFDIFWKAFTVRPEGFGTVFSPMLLVLVLFTWLIGALTAIDESREEGAPRTSVLGGIALYVGLAAAVFVIFGLVQAARTEFGDLTGLAVFRHIAGHVVLFDLVVLLLLLGLAAAIALSGRWAWPAAFARRSPASMSAALILGALAMVMIATLNVRSIQADTYYKQGLGYEEVGQWEGSVILYREAARLQPQEDYYYLFLGRALLQLADQAPAGNPILPEDVSQIPTDGLLGLVDRATQSGAQEDILRAAHAVLVGAQRLNPLNTDHSANLARLHRSWSFAGAATAAEAADPARLREILETQPEAVNQARLLRSLDYYQQALALSPNNAGLWNELATVQSIQGDLAGALATLESSLAVDDRYYPTYVLLGDVLAAGDDMPAALDAYKQAAAISPKNLAVLSALGVAGAEGGDAGASIDAFRRIIEISHDALDATRAQFDQLNAEVEAAGGYGSLPSSATARRVTVERQLLSQEQQLYVAYRNLALVLRETGQFTEALKAAEQAMTYASESDVELLETLIADLRNSISP